MRHDADRVRRGDADAGITVINGQDWMFGFDDFLEKVIGQLRAEVFNVIGLMTIGDE